VEHHQLFHAMLKLFFFNSLSGTTFASETNKKAKILFGLEPKIDLEITIQ